MEAKIIARSYRGFSLVELLVSIAIVAILASLLLTALSQTKERGKRTVCISNLRQCYLALRCYADDQENGRYPHQRDGNGNPVPEGFTVRGRPGAYLTNEWNEVARQAVNGNFNFDASSANDGRVHDLSLRIFACPDLLDPLHLPGPEGESFSINYNYVGGASKWVLWRP